MQIRKNCLFILLITVSLVHLALTEEPTNFNYDQNGDDWPDTCINSSLHNQSPINLPKATDSDKQSYLFADFRSVKATGTRYNTTIVLTPATEGRFGQVYTEIIKEAHYSFKATEIRIRSGSEHRIEQADGSFKQYDLQVQIHTFPLIGNQNDKLVIGLLFEVDDSSQGDPFLAQIVQNSKGQKQAFSLDVDLSHLLRREEVFNFWFYLGSITYPPCRNKGMNWIIPNKIFKMSQTQQNFFKLIYPKGNWRKVQLDKGNEIGYATALPQTKNFEF